MRKKALFSSLLLAGLILSLSSCAGNAVKRGNIGGDEAGPDTTIIVGRIVVEPEPEAGEKGFFNSGYDGQVRLYCDSVLKLETVHDNSFWENWPVQVAGNEGQTFYYGIPNRRCYAVMAGYFLSRSDSYEIIHLPVSFTLDIQPGDGAVYIGTIKFTRDAFYNVKRIDVYDEYAKVYPEFVKIYGPGVKLKKAVARVLNK
jgi:hypothetical protein